MNDNPATATGTTPYEEFVWRRLEDPVKFFGYELPPVIWLVLLAVVMSVAMVYVVWMYVKDSKSIGIWWGSLLGLLRTCVYALLAVVFLLPARQSYLETRSESKVIVVHDVSASLHTSDALPTGNANEKLQTRMDKVFEFLRDRQGEFLTALEKKNPVTVYRFGSKLDENYLHFAGGRVWTRAEKENPERDGDGNVILPEVRPLAEEYWRAWLSPHLPLPRYEGPDEKRYEKLSDLNTKLGRDLVRGTNIGDSLLSIVNRELNNRVQGIVVFTDGRNTEGSPNAFRELEARAKASRVPIFVVAVGEDRVKVKIDIVDVRAPQQVQPEDKYRVKTEITGEGLGGDKLDVSLEMVHVKTTKKKVRGKDGKDVEQEVEEPQPIEIIEAENPDDPKSARAKITLTKADEGHLLVLPPPAPVVLDKGSPPRVEVEWQIDAAALAAAAKVDLNDPQYRGKKWEIGETKDDSEIKYQVRVPADKREGLRVKFHESTKVGMKVIKKPLRVLLVAAAANRDYQFVRSLLIREMEKKRLELAIHLQVPPGESIRRPGVVQDVPPERMLATFPDSFRKKKDLYDLASYDVVIGFDPDWKQFQPDQLKMIREWADKGGGMVLIGGYINTVELIRPREGEDAERYKPILDLLPVVLDDRRDYIERVTDDPFALDFEGASPEMEFLKLDDELDESKFKEDWQDFFFGQAKGRSEKAQRGFFSFYPVQRAKSGSIVIARFTDPAAKLKDNTFHPYIVTTPEALPRVMWIGSAETWRLREYREAYHERFWTKLVRYAAAKSKGAAIKTIRLESPSVVVSGRYMEVEAKIDDPNTGLPLDRNEKPRITLRMPPGVPDAEVKQPIVMTPRPGARDGWFSGRFLVRSPGEYEFTVSVPRPGMVAESEQSESAKFTVKEANPELDNTRPDFDRMFRLASEADEVFLRMSEGDRNEVKRRLSRPKLETGADNADKTDIREDKARLYFDLKNAGLIPSCMVQDVQVQRSRGKHRDLWDDGFVVHEYPKPEDPNKPAKPPIKVSYVLLALVGLLSTEWLIRKLLRLA